MALDILPLSPERHLWIRGGRPLRGEIAVSGAKNAALPILAASVLAQGPVVLEGIPAVGDVRTMLELLEDLGCEIAAHHCHATVEPVAPAQWLRLVHRHAGEGLVNATLLGRMRAGFCLMGPLLARYGSATLALPGGCRIGPRPVELHLRGLAALGARIEWGEGFIVATADRLRGAEIDLTGPYGSTVTGTINVMAAATMAKGTTIIHGAAREPEVADTACFLRQLGANIRGDGTNRLEIAGVECLGGGSHRIIPDRVEAATLLLAGAVTGGQVCVTGVAPNHLNEVCRVLRLAGAELDILPDRIALAMHQRPQAFAAIARPYPGLPTDLQAPFTVLASVARGRSTLTDSVFPERFDHLAGLRQLGARIERRGATVVVEGGQLGFAGEEPTEVAATDLRGAAALVLAALAAAQTTCLHGRWHLERGYQRLEQKLAALGAVVASDADALGTSRSYPANISEPMLHETSNPSMIPPPANPGFAGSASFAGRKCPQPG